ncbi:MAG: thiamine pyrophosphate-binding protein, partial [Dehalococcoidia bacterium]|nr:thiamine pyrophosphate-binding protein [Dehalococcoidia bacterium]
MRVADVVAEILKREGVDLIIGYPVNDVLEAAARADIRTVIVRQERVGIHMADAMSRVTSGQRIGVFAMQHGPGTENAFGAVAQAYADSVPVLLLPEGYPRPIMNLPPNFSALLNFREIAKWVEQVVLPSEVPNALRRAWTQLKNGRPRPVVIELPRDLVLEEFPGTFEYRPAPRVRVAPDPVAVDEVAAVLVA